MSAGFMIPAANVKRSVAMKARRNGARSKYGVRTDAIGKSERTVDGILFASKAESKRYVVLKQLVRAGEIWNLSRQPKWDLHAVGRDGKPVKIGTYAADFHYITHGYVSVYEDVKGVQTEAFKWKKKHVEAEHGITVNVVGRKRPKKRPRKKSASA
jgi:hypothetical protein